MALEVVAEVVGGLVRLVAEFMSSIVFEILVVLPGLFIARHILRRRDIDQSDGLVIALGLAFWLLIGVTGYLVYDALIPSAA